MQRARHPSRADADLPRLRTLALELEPGCLAKAAGALAAHLNDSLAVSCHSDDFAEARKALAAAELSGLLTTDKRPR
ncbi:MAG TPA: hypothetical protein VFH61_17750 [Thermoleophilia bacterium]|nr:hypothetical protein [Thermoleophilia bacterium]